MKTLKEKVEIMQAALDGKEIEIRNIREDGKWLIRGGNRDNWYWSWEAFDFRIKPEKPREWLLQEIDPATRGYRCIFSPIRVREVLPE